MQEPTTPPPPEAINLEQRTDDGSAAQATLNADPKATARDRLRQQLRRRNFRPSRKATIFGLLAVLILVGTNVGVVWFIFSQHPTTAKLGAAKIIDSQTQLNALGVNKSTIGSSSVDLIITPGTEFKGSVVVDKQLQLTGKLTASDASVAGLQAGNTSLTQLNVSGASTFSNLSIRNNLLAVGTTRFQGAVTIDTLLTAGNINVPGNLTVGGALTTANFSARSLTSSSTLTIGGHIITQGRLPAISAGSVGNNGTVNISGNDSAGRININIGTGSTGGILASIHFASAFGTTPNVLISPIGAGAASIQYYVDGITSGGFLIGANNSIAGGGYSFAYIVEQ